MKQSMYRILSNEQIAQSIYRMRLGGDVSPIAAPGQFVNIRIDGLYLRRPISVCDVREDEMTLVYKTVGRGTAKMSEMEAISSAVSETDSIPQGAGKIRFLSVAASAHLRYTCSAVGLSKKAKRRMS